MTDRKGIDVKEIKTLMTSLDKSNSASATLDILEQLRKGVRPSEKLLRETKLGIAVNKLRSHPDKKVADMVKLMIKKWKDEVTAQKQHAHALAHSSTSTDAGASSSAKPTAPSSSASPDATSASGSTLSAPAPASAPSPVIARPKVVRPANGAPRDVKTDNVRTDFYGDKVRNSCVTVTYNALASDSDAHSETILQCSKEIELVVFRNEKGTSPSYRTKMRSLYLNLKDAKNPNLRSRVVAGEISAERLYRMSPQEMASEELKNEIKQLQDQNLFNARGAKEERAVTDRFTCGKCKQKKVSYYQMQTRSADEPLTTFCTCENCGNRWKFS
ncbi:transcription factor S-II, central domain-containing protein [Limtongia smithiae]|uniref:transcription factor S-II, central domain-containing protein n=1 Tax=Limtongia smithiae TaxID=1125753 RepID=UPI0034CFC2B0